MNAPENMTLQETIGQAEKQPPRSPGQTAAAWVAWPGRAAVLIAIVIAPWMIGSVEVWPQRLLMLLMLIGVASWWFESAVMRKKSQIVPYISVPLILGLLLGFLQTVPLSPAMGEWLAGRQTELYQQFVPGGASSVRISMDVESTWQQLRLLTLCLAGLLLGCRFFRTQRDLTILLAVCTANCAVMSFFAIIQKLTGNGMIFWVIELSSGGNPYGPYVNRNNATGLLLMGLASAIGLCTLVMGDRQTAGPVQMVSKEMPFWRQFYFHLLYFISELTATKIAILLAMVMIATGVLASLSRGGVAALMIGTIITIAVYGMARKPKHSGFVLLPLLGLVLALASWIGASDQLLNRFERTNLVNLASKEQRLQNWRDTWPAVEEMGLFGSGLGSYSNVHRLYRLDDEKKLFQHAENQYFQGLVEAGWPGLLLFCLALWLLFQCSALCLYRGSSASTIAVGATGIFLLSSQMAASFLDFGLYLPANALLASVLVGFVSYHAQSLAGRLKRASWLRLETPNWLVLATLLGVFAIGFLAMLQLHREVAQDRAMRVSLQKVTDADLNLAQTTALIEDVSEAAKYGPTSKSMNYLGNLWVHRARLQWLDLIKEQDPNFMRSIELKTDEEREKFERNIWRLTSVPWMQEYAYSLRRDISPFRARRFLSSSFIRDNLPFARSYFDYSRRQRPLQPLAHLEVGKISGVLEPTSGVGDPDIERATALAPSNSSFHNTAAIYYLQSGKVEPAAVHLRKYLELKPSAFKSVLALVTGRASRTLAEVNDQFIFEQILPDQPAMLYAFAKDYLASDSSIKPDVLAKADIMLGDPSAGDLKEALLKAQVKLARDDPNAAIEFLRIALISRPDDSKTRFSLAMLLQKTGQLEEAAEQTEYLLRLDGRNRKYNQLEKTIRSELRRRDQSRDLR